MTPKEQLNSILQNDYKTAAGEIFKIELLPGLNSEEIAQLENELPNKYLPIQIQELLKFCKGFKFESLGEILFYTFGYFGFSELFPYSIQLAEDGLGNFWVLDIDSKGNWNSVYFVCHDPPVLVKQSENLTEFIKQLGELKKDPNDSLTENTLKLVSDIWIEKNGIMEKNQKDYPFENNSSLLPKTYLIADLKNKPIKNGFAWGKFGSKAKVTRPTDEPIWVIEKKVKQGFLSRLFHKRK